MRPKLAPCESMRRRLLSLTGGKCGGTGDRPPVPSLYFMGNMGTNKSKPEELRHVNEQDSVYYTSRTDKPRRIDAPQQRDNGQDKQGWRNGISKPHRIPCPLCGGLIHRRGRHFSPAHVKLLLSRQQRESERARSCGYQAGQ